MKAVFYIVLFFSSTILKAQNKFVGSYADYFGSMLELRSDSTFDYSYSFDLNSTWTKGIWSVKNHTIYFKWIPIYDTIWELLMDKYDKVNFNPQLNENLSNNTFYENLNEENIFFATLSVADCLKLAKERGYIYISSEDISVSWKPVKFIRDNGLLKVTNDLKFPASVKFDSWDKLNQYFIPSTSILIFDKYIFSDSGNQRLTENLFKLLEKLCLNFLLKPLTLSIISEFKTDEQIINAHKKVEIYFAEKGLSNIAFNILKHDKAKYPADFEGLHYRLILTNNLRIKCDDSFNFFKRNGKINNDADIHISLHMCHLRKCFFEKELNHIKRYVSRLNNLPLETQLVNKIYCYPDKNNYLFN